MCKNGDIMGCSKGPNQHDALKQRIGWIAEGKSKNRVGFREVIIRLVIDNKHGDDT